jgi:hypothetical protein
VKEPCVNKFQKLFSCLWTHAIKKQPEGTVIDRMCILYTTMPSQLLAGDIEKKNRIRTYNHACTCFNANGDKCNHKFEKEGQLKSHMEHIHRGQSPRLKCVECKETFAWFSHLRKHRLRFHASQTDPKRIAFYATTNKNLRKQCANDDLLRVEISMRNAIRRMREKAGIGKKATTEKTIGCNPAEFIAHLNNNDRGFVLGDDDTHGRLDIDHIRPLNDMKKGCQLDLRRLTNFNNLQLLPACANRTKHAKFTSADAARYAEKEGKAIELLVPGWIAAGVCKCVSCVVE